jgi:hypothetical protein
MGRIISKLIKMPLRYIGDIPNKPQEDNDYGFQVIANKQACHQGISR